MCQPGGAHGNEKIMSVVQKIFGTHSEREIKRINGLVDRIEGMRPGMMELTEEQMRDKTKEFKKRLSEGETLDDLLPEAYALVREAARRVLNTEHYRVQLIGGIILHQGRIAEMRTGEGKTQTCLLPAYLNALEGKGVHVVTVNDYLAKRDAEWMGQVHEFLGLKVGCVLNDMKSEERREAYNCDITYVTNNELGFDYLRDNMVISTNMAGRGTDIKLDEEARAAGGLMIIGTERHESRRIDNQLRGRSGRQGDPGESKFFISLEDDLMRLFGSDRMITMFNALGIPEGQEIEHSALTKAIETAQKKIENNNFGIRKSLLEYDQVMNEQREIIYEERRRVLDGESMRDAIYKMITDIVENCVDICIGDDSDFEDWDYNELNTLLIPTVPLKPVDASRVLKPKKNSLKQQLKEEAVKLYESKEAEFPEPEAIREIERVILLKVIDRKWMDHIDDMDQLRQGAGLQAYGQKDPLVEYKLNGYEMFDDMTQNIKEETVRLLFRVRIEQKVEREQVAKVTGTNKDDTLQKGPVKRAEAKVYPNDPCPCGSGKKYKQCCGRK